MCVGKETVTETLGNKARTKQRVTPRLPVRERGELHLPYSYTCSPGPTWKRDGGHHLLEERV